MLAIITDRTDTDLTTDISDSHTQLTCHKARFILSTAEFERRELARRHGAPTTATWLKRTFGLSRATAYEYLGVGRKLQHFPQLAQAFLDAEFSYSVVRLLLRHMTDENVEELIDLARKHPLTELLELFAGQDQPNSKPTSNKISMVVDPESGDMRFWGRLDPERGAEFIAALKDSPLSEFITFDAAEEDVPDDRAEAEELNEEADFELAREEPMPGSRSRFKIGMPETISTSFMELINTVRGRPTKRARVTETSSRSLSPEAPVTSVARQEGASGT
ncbi:hypothetical protein [Corynebacterium nasicanis]|uniref:DUF222 domain-containing protein n=1 Tax=Corynebacterium nasicanis TaxID=1448267 RepID=A0ABW1QBP3_9CORY